MDKRVFKYITLSIFFIIPILLYQNCGKQGLVPERILCPMYSSDQNISGKSIAPPSIYINNAQYSTWTLPNPILISKDQPLQIRYGSTPCQQTNEDTYWENPNLSQTHSNCIDVDTATTGDFVFKYQFRSVAKGDVCDLRPIGQVDIFTQATLNIRVQ